MASDETIRLVRGETREIPYDVDVADILPDTLAKAWFTVKRSIYQSDAAALIQKVITPVLSDDGQIELVGAAGIDGHLSFLLDTTDTELFAANVRYYYDVKAKSSTGAEKVLESGRIYASSQITQADS